MQQIRGAQTNVNDVIRDLLEKKLPSNTLADWLRWIGLAGGCWTVLGSIGFGWPGLRLAGLALWMAGRLPFCRGGWQMKSEHLRMYNELSDKIPNYMVT